MKLPFDKVYVLSMPSYKERYEFVKYQLNELGIDFEFIWGTDFGNIDKDSLGYKMNYPQLWEEHKYCTGKDFSCTVSHYNAVYRAYEFGYNNVLIIEDDICFIKNKKLIEFIFDNIPEEADFVTYDPRFFVPNDFKIFFKDLNKNYGNLYMKADKNYVYMIGGMLYGIMNRDTMQLYLENQRKNFFMSDHVQGLFVNVTVNKYISTRCICTDEHNIKENFNAMWDAYKNNYKDKQKLQIDNFYIPEKYNVFARF